MYIYILSSSKASGVAETLGTSALTTMGHSNFVSTGVVGRVVGRLRGVAGVVGRVPGLPLRWVGVRSVSKPSRSKPVISKGSIAFTVLGDGKKLSLWRWKLRQNLNVTGFFVTMSGRKHVQEVFWFMAGA